MISEEKLTSSRISLQLNNEFKLIDSILLLLFNFIINRYLMFPKIHKFIKESKFI